MNAIVGMVHMAMEVVVVQLACLASAAAVAADAILRMLLVPPLLLSVCI